MKLVAVVFFVTALQAISAQDYFWLPWNKKVPKNAFQGGFDSKGRKIYVGFGYYYSHDDKDVLPSFLYEGEDAHSHLGQFKLNTDLAWVRNLL